MSSTTNTRSSGRPLCRYFANNVCFKGDDCEFSHDPNSRPDMVCRYYLQGACTYGSRCRYDHVRPNRETTNKNNNAMPKASAILAASNKSSSLNQPNIVTKLSANSKPFVPASSIIPKNPWQNNGTAPLNNFHKNLGLELELIGEQESAAACSSNTAYLTPIQNPSIADLPICPYFEMGNCPEGDVCLFIHGLPCEMCGLNVLHPHNENQRKIHHRACLADHEEQMEAAFAEAKSAQMQCGICMEMIVEKGLRFGILQNCAHCYCLDCIRKWRKHNDEQIKTKTVRACPECRIHSDYVIPSKRWIDNKEEKDKLLKLFHENTKKIQCKYVVGGDVNKCPFGNKCFYKHQMPDGTIAEGKSPTALRKERRHAFDLYDFIFFSSSSDDDDDMDTRPFSRNDDSDENFSLWFDFRNVDDE